MFLLEKTQRETVNAAEEIAYANSITYKIDAEVNNCTYLNYSHQYHVLLI